ncbi:MULTISPECIES: terminase small subunit [Neptunomonas]|uniref:Terminase small subunit n=1 Tax=Neptunomonas marina TaxID=1815562 RepID=A0A437QE45_9GAMM|nr:MULTISPECIES: terminase small subunit [Neptunomonas]RVU32709.1 terminase small subunit [Neptunomonas marina]
MGRNKEFNWTEQRREFCRQYIIQKQGQSAAITAGYSPASAGNTAYKLLKMPEINAYIAELMEQRIERTKIDADYVLQRLVEIDQMDVLDIMHSDGSFKHIADWPPIWRQFISGMDVAELHEGRGDEREMIGILKKIKWPDKLKNLELLGKHVNVQAFKDKVEHSGKLQHEELTDDQIEARIAALEQAG